MSPKFMLFNKSKVGEWNRAGQLLKKEAAKKRSKAMMKRREADKLEAEAMELEREAAKRV